MSTATRHVDARPLRLRILATLDDFPDGASTRELAAVMGDAQYSISSVISKMAIYGAPIDKIGKSFGPGTKWRLRKRLEGM